MAGRIYETSSEDPVEVRRERTPMVRAEVSPLRTVTDVNTGEKEIGVTVLVEVTTLASDAPRVLAGMLAACGIEHVA